MSRTRTDNELIYDLEAKEDGWSFSFREPSLPGARYFLNGKPTIPSASGLHLEGRKNRIMIELPRG